MATTFRPIQPAPAPSAPVAGPSHNKGKRKEVHTAGADVYTGKSDSTEAGPAPSPVAQPPTKKPRKKATRACTFPQTP